jgi:hypothetical protein
LKPLARSRKNKANNKKWFTWLRLISVLIPVSFCSGFIFGVGVHRDPTEIAGFVDNHIRSELSDGSAMLVFQCGDSQRLVIYELLSDEIFVNREAIYARLHNPLLKFTQTELFGAAGSFVTSSLGAAYSIKDEIKLMVAGKSTQKSCPYADGCRSTCIFRVQGV